MTVKIEKIISVYEKSRLGDFYRKKIPFFPKTTPDGNIWKTFFPGNKW